MSKHKLFFDTLAYSFNKGSWDGLVRLVSSELDKQRVKGEKRAEERITKLLEGLDLSVFGRIVYSDNRDELIALIKGEGENK